MPKIKDRSSLSERQRRRLVEKEYKNLCNTTEDTQLIARELPLPVIAGADPAKSIDSTSLDNNILHSTCEGVNSVNSSFRSNSSSINSAHSFECVELLHETDEKNFQNDLRNWAVARNICHADLNALLKLLRAHGFSVPSDSRTLSKTPRNLKVIEMIPGNYFHFGLRQGLLQSISQYYSPDNCPSEIKINVNVDGLPLTKSSGSQFWPILAAIEADFQTVPFVIGIYHGNEKPHDSNEFLKYFVDDFEALSGTGIVIKNQIIQVKINAFVCDAPAKAYISGTKGHNAYFGCGKCIQEGEFIENRVTYPDVNSTLRTDKSFRQKLNEEHHKKLSILERLLICMISIFPLDYMHLVCLGVMKKLLQFWVKGKRNVRMTNANLTRASNHLLSLSSSISKEFSRKARPLQDVDRFKATELRQLLLYTGPVIFKDNLTKDQYNHFLSLSIAIRILGSSELHLKYNDYARSLLLYFVKTFPLLYGHQHVSYNVHNLVHLCDDVQAKGPLDKFSAFKFENHMQKIKKMVKSSSKPLQQFIYRHEERYNLNSSGTSDRRSEYPIIKYNSIQHSVERKIIKSIQYDAFSLSTKVPDNCCCLKDDRVIIVEQIYLHKKKVYFIGKTFSNCGSLFQTPCNSSKFGITVVANENCQLVRFQVSDIKYKCLRFISTNGESVIVPLLHHQQ